MRDTTSYYKIADKKRVKKYGQFFTPDYIAKFMADWVAKDASNILDPAIGNSLFFRQLKNDNIKKVGYDIDKNIVDYFDYNYEIIISDYLLSDVSEKFDAIICNPPYNRFQSIDNRKEIKKKFLNDYNIELNGYTNQAILFLIKSIMELKKNGRIAYIIPTDFLESSYGEQIKELMLKQNILYSIINLEYTVFDNATTTSCILLLQKCKNENVKMINIKNKDEFLTIDLENTSTIRYEDLNPKEKWLKIFRNQKDYNNLVKVNKYLRVSRGIATGCNEFFILSENDIKKNKLYKKYFKFCISRSADVKNLIFSNKDIDDLNYQSKRIYLLDINEKDVMNDINLQNYIAKGEIDKINEKYLLKCRSPWYSMEKKKISPIWITNASRGNIKIVRNITNTHNLTTFHSAFIHEKYKNITNIIFCYLVSNVGQEILQRNKKTMGGGLDKYQPSDLNDACMLDLEIISSEDIKEIETIYDRLKDNQLKEDALKQLDSIFLKYL